MGIGNLIKDVGKLCLSVITENMETYSKEANRSSDTNTETLKRRLKYETDSYKKKAIISELSRRGSLKK